MHGRTAYVDESFHEHDTDGFYVLSAAVFDSDESAARDTMRGLRGRRHVGKLHRNEMDHADKETASRTVGALGGLYVVTIGTPVPRRKQERARRISLRRLVFELYGLDVIRIVIEAREDSLNHEDVKLVRDSRFDLPKGNRLRVDHQFGAYEPLLWVADIVAGAVRASRQGLPMYRALLGSRSTPSMSTAAER